jgi:murein L,D-transpeptidase YafK
LILFVVLIGIILLYQYGRSLWIHVYFKIIGKRTVAEAVEEYSSHATQRFLPNFQAAGVEYPPEKLILLGLKNETQLEVWAKTAGQITFIHSYPVLAASGGPGPKLREGDRQVPEGFYRIISLNPNSSYHLSMELNYPNSFDLQHADEERQNHLGRDIFIHGKAASIGCLAMGDPAIEELFIMVEKVGRPNVSVIIAPHDPRQAPLQVESSHPAWTADLYKEITEAFRDFTRQPSPA